MENGFGQSNNTEDFERTAIFSGAAPTTWTSNQSTGGYATTGTLPINGSRSLTYTYPATGVTNPYMSAVLAGSTFTMSSSDNWEWTFIYQAPASPTTAEAVGKVSGNRWRFYVNANGTDPTQSGFFGYYVTQDGNALKFYQYGYGSLSQTNNSITPSATSLTVTPGNKYIIRIIHQGSNQNYLFYAKQYTSPTSFPSSSDYLGSIYDQLNNAYSRSFFETSVTNSGALTFKWDDLKMYKSSIVVSPLTTATYGIKTTIFPGDINHAYFGFSITANGQATINQINIDFPAGNNGTYFSNARIYESSTNNVYGPNADDTPIGTGVLNGNFVGFTSLNSGNGLVITNEVRNYFLVLDVKAFDNTSSPSSVYFRLEPSGSSTSQQIPMVTTTPYTAYNTINFDGSPLTMPPATTFIWAGRNSTNPTDNANWSNYQFPGNTSDIVIPGGLTFYPIVPAGGYSSNNLTFTGTGSTIDLGVSTNNATISGSVTIEDNATATIKNGNIITANALNIGTGATLNSQSEANFTTLTNNGILTTASKNTTFTGGSTNSGSINLTGAGSITFQATMNNSGTVNKTGSGALTFGAVVTNTATGTITQAASAGELKLAAAQQGVNGNNGTINHTGAAPLNFSAALDNNKVINQSGTGVLTISSVFTNLAGASVNQTGTGTLAYNSITNTGTIAQTSTGILNTTGAVTNNNGGIITLGGGNSTFGGDISNASGATFNLGSGGLKDFNGTNFTNTGTATMTGGTANIAAATFTNSATTGSFRATGGTINFDLAGAQNINNANTSTTMPILFNNLTLSGTGAKTLNGSGGANTGLFKIGSTGILTVGSGIPFAVGTLNLTLNSDANGSATVGIVPTNASVTGTLNVERFYKGSPTSLDKRGYRLISSPVYTPNGTAKVISLNYLAASMPVTGYLGTTNGFIASPLNNPSIWLYRDDIIQTGTSFVSGAFKGISKINNGTLYQYSTQKKATLTNTADTVTYIPVGNGVLFYFRGDKTNNLTNKTVAPFAFPEDVTAVQSGTLTVGTVDVQIWYKTTSLTTLSYSNVTTGKTNANTRGYNLLGNPYASTINFEKFNRAATVANSPLYSANYPAITATTAPTIYIFNPVNKQYETYMQKLGAITTADTTTNVNPGTAVGAASNMIASGQGFFLRATNGTQTFKFRENSKSLIQPAAANLIKIFSTNQTSMAATPAPASGSEPLIRLKLIADEINDDEIVVVLNSAAKINYIQNEDAEDIGGSGAVVSLSSLSDDKTNLSINRLPAPQKEDRIIPLLVDATAAKGLYSLNLKEARDLPALYQVWLKDAFTKDSLNLSIHPTYNFNIDRTNTATFGTNRFTLVIRQNPAMQLRLLDFSGTKANQSARLTWITENESTYTSFSVERSVDNGKTFTEIGTLQSSQLGNYSLLDNAPAKGLNQYRLKQTDFNGTITYSKVVNLTYSDNSNSVIVSNMSVFPNPTTNVVNVSIAVSQGNNVSYNIIITDGAGVVVRRATSTQPTWQDNVSNLKPGSYFVQVINNTNKAIVGNSKFIKN